MHMHVLYSNNAWVGKNDFLAVLRVKQHVSAVHLCMDSTSRLIIIVMSTQDFA